MSEDCRLIHGDCLEVMATLPDSSVDAIVTDPPYHRVKAEAWDRQWKDDRAFLGWIGELCGEWHRLLRPNGSLYVFASPRMAARVECEIGERFHVLNQIVWNKLDDYPEGDRRATAYRARDHGAFRRYFDYSERIIFAEHHGADSAAKGEAGYGAKCDELRGFVFEPLRAYLDGERIRAGLTPEQVNEVCGFRLKGGMAGRHWFNVSQFAIPTPNAYRLIQQATGCFPRSYESLRSEYESLRLEYESLRLEYETLRRPFSVSADVPYTDVWDFPTVPARPGKHPCEKPVALLEHIVSASTRPGAIVLDPFAGSGSTGRACLNLGRRFLGIERDPDYFAMASRNLSLPGCAPAPRRARPPVPEDVPRDRYPLFAEAAS